MYLCFLCFLYSAFYNCPQSNKERQVMVGHTSANRQLLFIMKSCISMTVKLLELWWKDTCLILKNHTKW